MTNLKNREILIVAVSMVLGGVITVAFLLSLFTATRIPSIITTIVVGPFGLAANTLTKALPSQMGATSDGLPSTVVFLPSLIINSIYLGGIIAGTIAAVLWLLRRGNIRP
jgi:hypothetical protein